MVGIRSLGNEPITTTSYYVSVVYMCITPCDTPAHVCAFFWGGVGVGVGSYLHACTYILVRLVSALNVPCEIDSDIDPTAPLLEIVPIPVIFNSVS